MTVYVTVRLAKTRPFDVQVHLSHDSAMRAREEWLREAAATDESKPKFRTEFGTDFVVLECPLTP